MSNYNIGDEYTCKEDFFMSQEDGGDKAFTKGKTYTIVAIDDDLEAEEGLFMAFIDDMDDQHYMDDDDMRKVFKKANDPITDAYDRAMGII